MGEKGGRRGEEEEAALKEGGVARGEWRGGGGALTQSLGLGLSKKDTCINKCSLWFQIKLTGE